MSVRAKAAGYWPQSLQIPCLISLFRRAFCNFLTCARFCSIVFMPGVYPENGSVWEKILLDVWENGAHSNHSNESRIGEEEMAKRRNPLQLNIYNERARLRKRMEALARSHRGCPTARGCGCLTDQTIAVLEITERRLFQLELSSYASADPHGGYDHYAKMNAEIKAETNEVEKQTDDIANAAALELDSLP